MCCPLGFGQVAVESLGEGIKAHAALMLITIDDEGGRGLDIVTLLSFQNGTEDLGLKSLVVETDLELPFADAAQLAYLTEDVQVIGGPSPIIECIKQRFDEGKIALWPGAMGEYSSV